MKLSAITHSKALLVEGQDEVNFFHAFLHHLGLIDVQVIEVGGKYSFQNEFPTFLALSGSERITAFAIIRDADLSHASTFSSIKNLLETFGQPCPTESGKFTDTPTKVGVFILPGNAETGMLESLCLQAVSDHPSMPCVEQFIYCLGETLERKKSETSDSTHIAYYPKNEEKAKMLAFLSTLYESTTSIGIAAQKGYWPFDHMALEELRNFLIGLAM